MRVVEFLLASLFHAITSFPLRTIGHQPASCARFTQGCRCLLGRGIELSRKRLYHVLQSHGGSRLETPTYLLTRRRIAFS
jgi:hypothetical protein